MPRSPCSLGLVLFASCGTRAPIPTRAGRPECTVDVCSAAEFQEVLFESMVVDGGSPMLKRVEAKAESTGTP